MKKIAKTGLLTVTAAITAFTLFSQDKKELSVSLGAGRLNSPYYTNAKAGKFYSFDLSHGITKRQSLAAFFIVGDHLYYDNVLSNNAVPLSTPGYEKNRNATADYRIFSVLYQYRFYDRNRISLAAGAGAGIMTHIREYPYTEGSTVSFRQSSWTDLAFPVRLELDYQISSHFQLGLAGGLFIHPDYPVLGYHAGPRLSYILR